MTETRAPVPAPSGTPMRRTRATGAPLPRWARAIDLICLALVAVAMLVAMSGGFHLQFGTTPFAVTSPGRVLLWALGLTIVRHAIAPQQPIYRHLAARIGAWAQSPAGRVAALVVVGTRPAIYFVGYLAVLLFGYSTGTPPIRSSTSDLLNLPVRWDAGWYLQIAVNGYSYDRLAGPAHQQNIVFFPAFPIVTRVLGLLLGNGRESYVLGATLASLAAFLFALVYIYLLARDEIGDDRARAAVWLLAAYPFALFFGAVYTESLFLLCAAGAFYHFRRHEYLAAGAWGLVAGLTRPNGAFLAVPLAIVAVSPWLPWRIVRADRPRDRRDSRALVPAIVAAAMPGVGVLIFSAFIWRLTGAPFAWAEGHVAWGRHYEGLATLVTDRYNFITQVGFSEYVAQLPIDLMNGLGVLFVLAATWGVARRLDLAYAVFILINILPPLAAGGLLSAGRLSAVLFPAFIWLATVVPARHRAGWIASFAAVQAFNAALFYTWRPLY